MVMFPGPLITGPEPVGRRYGLFSAASGPLDLPTKGRGGGLRYVPVTCGEAHPYLVGCAAGAVSHTEKEGDEQNPVVETGSFAVYASLLCGAAGFTEAEFLQQVERRLLNGEQGAAEEALWTGEDEFGDPLEIINFQTDGVNVSGSPFADFAQAVGALESYAYLTQAYGNVAYIHAPVSMAAVAAQQYLIVDRGGVLYTPFGSRWVFGVGYRGPGAGGAAPPANGAYMYVTGQVNVWRSADIFTYPPDQTMDRETNQRFLLSEREYAIGVDCFIGRALYNPGGE